MIQVLAEHYRLINYTNTLDSINPYHTENVTTQIIINQPKNIL